ncbi:MAG: response regulator [Syntrophales bacterium]|nr:response regulator [Syntrophales bacterium]
MGKPLRVLMVEDSEDDVLLAIRHLKSGGYEPEYERIETAEALRIALRGNAWDVIVCNYRLPNFDGLTAISLVKEAAIDIPLIISSGAIGEETAADCLRSGACDYVMKGNMSRLVSAVDRELKEAESRKRRRQAEAMLRESEERYRSLFNYSQEAILLTRPDGAILDANPAACELFGRSLEEIRSLGRGGLLDVTDPRLTAALAERAGRGGGRAEITMLRANGEKFPVEITSALFVDANGEQKTSMIIRDLSERKRAEAEDARLQQQLRQSQKMDSVGRLAGGIAHDFNNMLGVIIGQAELALTQVDPALSLHARLEEILKAANRSANLTRQLLAFARKQIISPQVLDLNETVNGMLEMLRRLIGEDIAFAWHPGADLWLIRFDPSQIDQIMVNLCVNARDAIAGVGRIAIETRNISLGSAYCAAHAGLAPGDYVILSVSDNGCGMSNEVLGKLFEPFFTTKAPGKGVGLGLATIFGIVKQNNGFIDVVSELNLRTTFTIYLPRSMEETAETCVEAPQQPSVRGSQTVLAVEDEPELLDLIKTILEGKGYRVLIAATPGEALQLASEHTGEIDLLITDVVMPEINGKGLAEKMLSTYQDMKCLFTSGYTADVIAHLGVLEEGVNFLPKPFSISDLTAKVAEVLAR